MFVVWAEYRSVACNLARMSDAVAWFDLQILITGEAEVHDRRLPCLLTSTIYFCFGIVDCEHPSGSDVLGTRALLLERTSSTNGG